MGSLSKLHGGEPASKEESVGTWAEVPGNNEITEES